ncbi:ABC transporter permease [Paramicrobacterium agarici]|uniref:Monosaccharide ABC transporter membrane protein (CUT2 family) n=1 Tax=Paramicrobacterium agarici TaxID=630514 RepID=A0A2A9DU28_9MICO|nr:ABC transporter permease [Microbacterium agarici]PFG29881.1 monosaccharide ABC transporter membrane protein (CUT2 family) [Microbacterium agarici]
MTTSLQSQDLQPQSRAGRLTWPAWGWSLVGVILVWASIVAVTSGSVMQPLFQALTLAPYLALVAVGQMMVITLGPGNIDVSVGTIVTVSAYVSVSIGTEFGAIAGIAAGVVAGVAASIISVFAILALRVPPIIATLATSLVLTSVILVLAEANRGGADMALRAFVNWRLFGVSGIALVVLSITVVVAFGLRKTSLGLSVIAIGQSAKAAEKAGIKVRTVTGATYILSGAFAGLAGAILSALISPSTVLGTSYMLDSIAVVVIGGTLIAGGRPVVTGVWTGAMFFAMLSSLLNLIGWSVGAQNILKGLLVVLVVVISSAASGTGKSSLRALRKNLTFNRNNN